MNEMQHMFKLPYDLEAEKAVIGGVFQDESHFKSVSRIIADDDFYGELNRELWRSMRDCIAEGQLDVVTLAKKIGERGKIDRQLGIETLVECCNFVPSSDGTEVYARQMEECGRRRRLLVGLSEACSALEQDSVNVADVTGYVQQALIIPNVQRKTVFTFGEAFEVFEDKYRELKARGVDIPGHSTGFCMLDYFIGGLEDEKMYVIGARPGMGKTAFALMVACSLAMAKKNTIYFSLEMGAVELVERIISMMCRVNGEFIKSCTLDEKDIAESKKLRQKIERYLVIDDSARQTMQSITLECVALKAELEAKGQKLDCVFIDHMQLLNSNLNKFDRRTQIGEASRMCKALSKDLKCPVVVLSQLSRENKNRTSKEPLLTDLRESGDIEQDADVVLFLHRDGYYDKEADQKRAKVIIAKNRSGKTGSILFGWDGPQTRYEELPWEVQRSYKK